MERPNKTTDLDTLDDAPAGRAKLKVRNARGMGAEKADEPIMITGNNVSDEVNRWIGPGDPKLRSF